MRRLILAALALSLPACGEEMSEAERQAQDAALTERVREANQSGPPLEEIVPDPILFPDIEANDLFGAQCAFAPGTSMGARVIAREADAFMKINGEVVRFAADPGARELPAYARTLYNSREFSLRLEIDDAAETDDAAKADETESKFLQGTIYLRDRFERVVYQGSGAVSCNE